jgi:dipeptidyl aminopeptidase/acylaminoacyl peptidase
MRPRLLWMILALVSVLPFSAPAGAAEEIPPASLKFFKDLAETRDYTLGKPVAPRLTRDGRSVLFLRGGARDPVMALYMMEVKTGKIRKVLTPDALLKGSGESLSVEEKARRERMRMTLRGFTSFEISEDGSRILVPFSGKLYVVDLPGGAVTELPAGPEAWIDPRFSPDGRTVAAVRGGELYAIDIASRKESRLTSGATDTLAHGLAEFVAQEEMGRFSGYWWSPDSSRLAFEEADVSEVERLYIMNPLHPEDPPDPYFYPRAGKVNARVRLGVIARSGGAVIWLGWDSGKYPYLARVIWKESAPLTILVQTRDQREEKILAVDPTTGACRELLTETDSAWLNLDGKMPEWFPDGKAFLWTTEKRGSWQLELHGADGRLLRELTPVTFTLTGLADADPKAGSAVVEGGPDARETHLYRVSFKGGDPVRLTREPGMHSAAFSKDHRLFLHTFQLLDGRSGTRVETAQGKILKEIHSVAERPPFFPKIELTRVWGGQGEWGPGRGREYQERLDVRPVGLKGSGTVKGIVVDKDGNPLEAATLLLRNPRLKLGTECVTDSKGEYRFSSVAAGKDYTLRISRPGYRTLEFAPMEIAAGRTVVQNVTLRPSADKAPGDEGGRWFDAVVIRPRSFERGRKYPVILSVYAGPTTTVVRANPREYLRDQWMADQGYIVVSLDGRGTPGHGRAWERAIKGNLIEIALADQVAGLKALGEKYPEMDLSRVGVTGWSFGGYFTVMATLMRPDIFRCGVAGAPVTDWLDYDTHYTERYMDLPAANPEGYRKTSALTYAPDLKRPLLLIHGLTDDNVYVMHTLKLADALYRAGRPFDLLPLTGTHLMSDPVQTLRLWTRIIDFFNAHLGGPQRAVGETAP